FFFFQAEDGIRDFHVTGVQTCALPIFEIEWEAESGERFFVRLELEGSDRRGLVADIASVITSLHTNIKSVNVQAEEMGMRGEFVDRKSTRLNSSHVKISYAVFCLKKKK